jgi:hypothetical protein
MKPLYQINKRYRQILIASLMSSGSLLPLLPAFADPLLSTAPQNSAAPGEIQNQATAEFIDSADDSVGKIVSDIVKVDVAEIAGISATGVGVNSAVVGTAPTLYPTSTAYFDFVVKNEGNDPTQLFIPAAPSVATVNGTAVVAGQLQIINYNTITPGTGTTTIPAVINTTAVTTGNLVNTTTGSATGSLTGLPSGGSVPPGGYVTVRVPITIPFGTPHNAPIVVTLGNTPTAPVVGTAVNNMPYVVSGVTTGTKDLYTQDNTLVNTTNADVASRESNTTVPFNGEREASATQTALVIVPKIVISGKVYDDANNTALNTFTNIQDGNEVGAVVPNTAPVYALLVDSTGKVIGNSIVKNDGTNGATGTNGTYSFSNIDGFQNGLTVVLSSSNLPLNTIITATTPSLPTGWTPTSPLTYTAFNVGGDTAAELLTYTGKDFGIELLPTAVGFTVATQVNPVGVNLFTVPATVFTSSTDLDPNATGGVAKYKITAFPSNTITLTVNGTVYTAANFPTATGVTFTLAELNAGAVKVDPIDGASTVDIPFQAIDNAGKTSLNTAIGSLPFSAASVTISGTVYNDRDKSAVTTAATGTTPTLFTNIKPNTTAGVDDSGTDTLFGTNGTPIYATLYNTTTNQVIATQLIPNTGIYSFAGVTATTNVKVILSTTAGIPGSATAPTAGLPTGWNGTTAQDSGTFNTGNYGTNVATGGFAPKDFGVIQKAKLVIIKRITKIGKTAATMSDINPNDSTSLAGTSTDSFNFNATKNPTAPSHIGNWPANYIVGATDAGKVVPGDFIEYTIYFLNNQGSDAKNVKICDPIRGSQDYVPSSTTLNLTSNPTAAGTGVSDTASRLNVFTGNTVPANCNMGAAASTGTNNGGVAIDITTIGTGTATADQPVGIPGATSATAPGNDNTYGMFRFRTQVKP